MTGRLVVSRHNHGGDGSFYILVADYFLLDTYVVSGIYNVGE